MAINLFDPGFYAQANPDLANAGLTSPEQLTAHFFGAGLNEGRAFSPFADLNVYRAANPDLAGAGLTANSQLYGHLVASGVAEGRAFSAVYDANFYRAANPDVAAAGFNNEQLFDHFRVNGIREGRVASAAFNPSSYLALNPDLRAAGLDFAGGLIHYRLFGATEGRPTGGSAPAPVPPPVPVPIAVGDTEPNNTDTQAVNVDLLTGQNYTINGFVGSADERDYYRFRVDPVTEFSAVLNGLTQDADIDLYLDKNSNARIDSGERLTGSSNFGTNQDSISRPLGPGNYWLKVERSGGNDTRYTLNLSGLSTGRTDSGGNIGNLSGERRFSDFVGNTDGEDNYIFTVDSVRDFNATLTGLRQDADLDLYLDENRNGFIDSGERITGSSNFGTNVDSITRSLAPAQYILRVEQSGSSDTLYDLALSA
ncbi:MAG: hypothetical protein HC795_09275 [Coleofasciculaceae cyanobacterium RL_1_1]|nr:hypothetical protein [Coleofasciculaceae cyanobacterium RL_1_1]